MTNLNNDEFLQQDKTEEKINPVEEYVNELKNSQKNEEIVNDSERPDFLLPQFKNIEEQAKSYKELQSLQTKQAQELAQYKKKEALNAQKNSVYNKIEELKNQAKLHEQQIKEFYSNEINNLYAALQSGKISQQEAQKFAEELKTFVQEKLNVVANKFKNACSQCGQTLEMTSPRDYFQEDLVDKNYIEPICQFLEKNYKQLPKTELEGVKKLIENLEKSLRDEILNETQLNQENENYRKNLNSTTNLNPNTNTEKIYTLAEIKNMKPEEFRKNQKVILEQFAARKIR